MEPNVFEAPKSSDEPTEFTGELAEAERIRRQHLNHEANVGCIGALFFLGGIFLAIAAVVLPVNVLLTGDQGRPPQSMVRVALLSLFFAGMAALYLPLGWYLARFKPWARTVVIILISIGIGLNVLGTLSNAQDDPNAPAGLFGLIVPILFLAILLSSKSKVVFSPEYQEILRQTPHVKRRTSPIVWIFLVPFLVLLLIAVIAALVGQFQ